MTPFALAALLAVAPPVQPTDLAAPFPTAQSLADETVAATPSLIDVIMHVSPSPDAPNVVVAAHLRRAVGEASGADDLGVAETGAPLVEVQKDGVRLGVLVQLRDGQGRAIGALGLMYAYRPGDDVEAAVRHSFLIRDRLAARIPSRAVLTARGRPEVGYPGGAKIGRS